jgi:hypothetical protein
MYIRVTCTARYPPVGSWYGAYVPYNRCKKYHVLLLLKKRLLFVLNCKFGENDLREQWQVEDFCSDCNVPHHAVLFLPQSCDGNCLPI